VGLKAGVADFDTSVPFAVARRICLLLLSDLTLGIINVGLKWAEKCPYSGRLGKDRSPCQSSHSVASAAVPETGEMLPIALVHQSGLFRLSLHWLRRPDLRGLDQLRSKSLEVTGRHYGLLFHVSSVVTPFSQ
jgi:hypothetical protein